MFSVAVQLALKLAHSKVQTSVVNGIVKTARHPHNTYLSDIMIADPNDAPRILLNNKYPARDHNLAVKQKMMEDEKLSGLKSDSTAVFIAGEEVVGNKYCDTDQPFRQNRYFYYLTGVALPGSAFIFDFKTDKITLFIPDFDEDDVMWSGLPLGIEDALKKFEVDQVFHMNELKSLINKDFADYTIYTTDLDNVHDSDVSSKLTPSNPQFFLAMDESRVIKDWYEIESIRKACQISDNCHLATMSSLPIEKNEHHIQAEFVYHAMRQGAQGLGYSAICGSGTHCGTLHYVDNTKDLKNRHSTLIDMGAEWHQYTSDVTRCFPIDGRFTKEHRLIYDTVLDMHSQVMKEMKPGVEWDDLHSLTHKILIQHLLDIGIFKKEFTLDQIFESRASVAFYPHGLGHMLGLDVHDVGGNANYDDPDPMFSFLRIRRTLKQNMVLTNEPGCYFNEFLIKEMLDKFPERLEKVDKDVLNKFMYVGGVRIEDDVLVTEHGCECLSQITSDPVEIEKIVLAGLKRKRDDFHVVC